MDIGIVGVGLMGRGIAKNLAESGFTVHAVDSKHDQVSALEKYGVRETTSLAELCNQCTRIITCLPSLAAVREVYLAPNGLITEAQKGTVFIDCTSSDPSLTREIGQLATQNSLFLVDAPILLGKEAAWEGRTTLILGGENPVIAACMPIFEAFSAQTIYSGALGTAHGLKAINNAVTLANHAILSEAFSVAMLMNVDLNTMFKVMSNSNANSAKLQDLAPRLLDENFEKTMTFASGGKDIVNFITMADSLGAQVDTVRAALGDFNMAAENSGQDESITRLPVILKDLRSLPLETNK